MSDVTIICPHCGALNLIKIEPLPDRAWGVYQLLDANERVLYVGMTGTPRKRIRRHLRELGDRVCHMKWDTTDSRVAAFDLETALIAEHRPPMNIHKVPD